MLNAHAPSLIAAAILLGVLTLYAGLRVAGRLRETHGNVMRRWMIGGTVILGIGAGITDLIARAALLEAPRVPVEPGWLAAAALTAQVSAWALLRTLGEVRQTGARLFHRSLACGATWALMHELLVVATGSHPTLATDPWMQHGLRFAVTTLAVTASLHCAFRLLDELTPSEIVRPLGTACLLAIGLFGLPMAMTVGLQDAARPGGVLQHGFDVNAGAMLLGVAVLLTQAIMLLAISFDVRTRSIVASLLNIAQQSNAELEELFAQRTRELEALYDRAPCGYHSVDFDGIIVNMNKTELDWLGYTRDEVVGKLHVRELHTPANWEQLEVHRSRVRSGSEIFVAHYDYVRKDGSVFPVTIHTGSIRDEDGRYLHSLTCVNDDSLTQKMYAELERKSFEANAANLAKSAFLASMSHEIRTPMNGVLGVIEVLDHTRLDDEQRELMATARESATALLTLIDEILDFTKIEADRLELERTALSPAQVVESACEALSSIADKNDIDLMLYCDPTLPGSVWTDPGRLRQILMNLGGNAVKFAKPIDGGRGRVLIRIDLLSQTARRASMRVAVIDNGIGMNDDTMAMLFRPFVQGESSTTRRFGGTGLGLSISQRIAQAMQTEISVKSRPGAGSTFSIDLDFELAPPLPDQDPPPSLVGLDVVIVSPNRERTEILSRYLVASGASAVVDADDDAAIARLLALGDHEAAPIVIVPDEDQAHRVQAFKQRLGAAPVLERLCFVALVHGGRHRANTIAGDTISIKANALRRTTLLRGVAIAAGRLSPTPGIEQQAVDAGRPSSGPRRPPQHAPLVLVAEDNETNRKVIGRQLAKLGYNAIIACDGEEALAVWRQHPFALVLTDCHMPKMDGFQLTRGIRAAESPDDPAMRVPIIAITANAMKGEAERCLAAGMDDYLTKPTQLDKLAATLRKWAPAGDPVDGDGAESAVAGERAAEHVGADSTIDSTIDVDDDADGSVDEAALPEAIGSDDSELLEEFYRTYATGADEILAEMAQCHAIRDLPSLGSLAHKLKSSSATIGAHRLSRACIDLERAAKAGDWTGCDERYRKIAGHHALVRRWLTTWFARRTTSATNH